MSVRIALCLLVVLSCYRDVSADAGLGEQCLRSSDCNQVNNAVCIDGVCTCTTGLVPDAGITRCLPSLGGQCTKSEDCKQVNNAVCIAGVCTCTTDLVPSAENTRCLPTVGYNETCKESVQCDDLGEATCDTVCKCKSSFTYNGIICAGNVDLGQPCNSDYECFVPNDLKLEIVWCYNKQCSCRNGYKRDGDRCVIGGDCTTDNDCKDLGNSFCDKRARERYFCACKQNYTSVANDTKCFPIATAIGSGCQYDEQCSQKLGNAVCTNYQCRCAVAVSPNNGNKCGIPADCSKDQDCSQLENAYCDNYQCKCKRGFKFDGNNTTCIPGCYCKSTGGSRMVTMNRDSNGDGASDLQVSMAALAVYWMVQFVTP